MSILHLSRHDCPDAQASRRYLFHFCPFPDQGQERLLLLFAPLPLVVVRIVVSRDEGVHLLGIGEPVRSRGKPFRRSRRSRRGRLAVLLLKCSRCFCASKSVPWPCAFAQSLTRLFTSSFSSALHSPNFCPSNFLSHLSSFRSALTRSPSPIFMPCTANSLLTFCLFAGFDGRRVVVYRNEIILHDGGSGDEPPPAGCRAPRRRTPIAVLLRGIGRIIIAAAVFRLTIAPVRDVRTRAPRLSEALQSTMSGSESIRAAPG